MYRKTKFVALRGGRFPLLFFFALSASVAVPFFAWGADDCSASKWPLAHESALLRAAPAAKSGSEIAFGKAARVTLSPVEGLSFEIPPDHEPAQGSYGAIVKATMPAETVQITLSGKAWIDVIQYGKTVASIDHTEGKGCPGVTKSVRFRMAEGPATIQLSGARSDSLGLSILPAD